ncbi:unnamed protein product [Cochlearia groenlandica]
MEKFSYHSYPDSNDSSPRSREIDFDNPPPWDDQNHHQQPPPSQSYKVKFMCSYGGKIQPRPHDNQLTYVNGETKILSVDRGIRFPVLASKLAAVCGGGDVLFKYQLPGEDLDALISVTNDEDLEHMMHEYDRLLRLSSTPARMRLFLFQAPPISGGFGSEGSNQSDRDRFVDVLNTVRNGSESEKSVTAPSNNADFLFGSEKILAPPPPPPPMEVKLPVPAAIEPPLLNDPRLIQPNLGVNPAEFQRIRISDHEQQLLQQQEALYRRKNEESLLETGGYFSQNQPTIPQTNTQAPPPAPPMTFWQGNHTNQGSLFPTTTPEQQQVYMIPSTSPHPGAVYHAQPPPQQQGVMRPIGTGQGNQGGYYPTAAPVQRMATDTYREQQQQQAYNMGQTQVGTTILQQQQQPPLPFTSGPPPPPQYSAVPPPRQVVGIPNTTAYTQVGYGGGIGKQVYYTEAPPPPHYHGIGLPVNGMNELRTGPDGKLVAVNMGPKVSSQNSDV